MKRRFVFREPMQDSFSDWNTKWQSALDQATSEIEFPEICYYCPQ